MAARAEVIGYGRPHHLIAAGTWDERPPPRSRPITDPRWPSQGCSEPFPAGSIPDEAIRAVVPIAAPRTRDLRSKDEALAMQAGLPRQPTSWIGSQPIESAVSNQSGWKLL